jgi:hypothetical protein
MKNSYLFLLSVLLICSCSDDEMPTSLYKGALHIDLGIFIHSEEHESRLKATVPPEDYLVSIFNADGAEIMNYEHASEMPDLIELQAGQYYVVAHSGNDLPAEFENPYFYGKTETFTVRGNETSSVTVKCVLANTMVSVAYSDYVKNNFISYSVDVASEAGSLVFGSTEARTGYFRTMPLTITANLSYRKPDGTSESKVLKGSIPAPSSRMHYEIEIDAGILSGMSSVEIMVDQSPVPTETVPINDNTDGLTPGAIAYGELLITEIMYDPVSLTDTYGEWFEIYNNSDHTINLENLVIMRDSLNRHKISTPVEVAAGTYYVLARTAAAAGTAPAYVYGSGISLTNSGAVLSIFNESTGNENGSLIYSIDYGAAGFPAGTGTSLSLDPLKLNAADGIKPSSWCTSVSVFSTGDKGTPGLINDICN